MSGGILCDGWTPQRIDALMRQLDHIELAIGFLICLVLVGIFLYLIRT